MGLCTTYWRLPLNFHLFIYFAFKREYRVFDNLFSYLFYLITMIIDITHMTCGAYCILMCWWFFLVLVPVGERLALRTHYMFRTFTDNISKYEVTILRQIGHFALSLIIFLSMRSLYLGKLGTLVPQQTSRVWSGTWMVLFFQKSQKI